jgi:hypothetical protein
LATSGTRNAVNHLYVFAAKGAEVIENAKDECCGAQIKQALKIQKSETHPNQARQVGDGLTNLSALGKLSGLLFFWRPKGTHNVCLGL